MTLFTDSGSVLEESILSGCVSRLISYVQKEVMTPLHTLDVDTTIPTFGTLNPSLLVSPIPSLGCICTLPV